MTITEPVWFQDLSEWYSNTSDCSIGYPVRLRSASASTISCAVVTGDRFFLFGMAKNHLAPYDTVYTVRPLDVLQSASASDFDGKGRTRPDDNDRVVPFRDRTATLMKCASSLAVWLSSGRDEIMTASISPLSAFSAEQRDALGLAEQFYGFDILPHDIAVRGLELPPGLDLRTIQQLCVDEVSGRVGIVTKGAGTNVNNGFIIMQPRL